MSPVEDALLLIRAGSPNRITALFDPDDTWDEACAHDVWIVPRIVSS